MHEEGERGGGGGDLRSIFGSISDLHFAVFAGEMTGRGPRLHLMQKIHRFMDSTSSLGANNSTPTFFTAAEPSPHFYYTHTTSSTYSSFAFFAKMAPLRTAVCFTVGMVATATAAVAPGSPIYSLQVLR